MKYENILQTIGETPVIKINRLAPEHVDLYVKMESEFTELDRNRNILGASRLRA